MKKDKVNFDDYKAKLKDFAKVYDDIKTFIPLSQKMICAECCRDVKKCISDGKEDRAVFEAFDDLYEKLIPVREKIQNAPNYGETDNMQKHPLTLHYFYGDSDWYIAEIDRTKEGTLGYGYCILNGWLDSAEWGSVDIDEIVSTKQQPIELELIGGADTIEDALYQRNPEYFSQYAPDVKKKDKEAKAK